jgi:hypothetical protein
MNSQDFQSLVERMKDILSEPYADADSEHTDDTLMGTDELDTATELEPGTPYAKHPARGKLVGELEERYRDFLSREDMAEQTPQAPQPTMQATKTPQELQAEKAATQAATKLAQTTGAKPQDLEAAISTAAQGQVPTGGAAQALASLGDDLGKAIKDPQLSQQLIKTVQAAKNK